MGLFLNILLGIMIFVCFLIVASILLQEDKSGGGIGIVGGSSQSFFGASSSSLLARITSVLVTLFFLFAVVIGILVSKDTNEARLGKNALLDLEFEEIESRSVNTITSLPESVSYEMFNSEILDLIEDEADKEKVLSAYEKDKAEEYYTLKSKIDDDLKNDVLEIIQETDFSFQTSEVKIKK